MEKKKLNSSTNTPDELQQIKQRMRLGVAIFAVGALFMMLPLMVILVMEFNK